MNTSHSINYDRIMALPLEEWLVRQQTELIQEITSPMAFVQDVGMLKLKLQSVQNMLRQATLNIVRFEGRPIDLAMADNYIINLDEAVAEAAEIAKEEAQKKAESKETEEKRRLALRDAALSDMASAQQVLESLGYESVIVTLVELGKEIRF